MEFESDFWNGNIYTIILLKSVRRCSQTAGRNSCSIVSGNVSNCSYRLKVYPITSSHLNSAWHYFYTRKTSKTIANTASPTRVVNLIEPVTPVTAVMVHRHRLAGTAMNWAVTTYCGHGWLPAGRLYGDDMNGDNCCQNGDNERHGLKMWLRNYYVAYEFVVVVTPTMQNCFLMSSRLKSHIIFVLDRLQCVARVNCLVVIISCVCFPFRVRHLCCYIWWSLDSFWQGKYYFLLLLVFL